MNVPDRDLKTLAEFYLLAKGWVRGDLSDEWSQRDLFCARVSLGTAAKKQIEHEQALTDFPEGAA